MRVRPESEPGFMMGMGGGRLEGGLKWKWLCEFVWTVFILQFLTPWRACVFVSGSIAWIGLREVQGGTP